MVEIFSWNPKHNKSSDLVLLAATCYSKSDKTQGFSGIYWSRKYMVCGMFNDCKGDAAFIGECSLLPLVIALLPFMLPFMLCYAMTVKK